VDPKVACRAAVARGVDKVTGKSPLVIAEPARAALAERLVELCVEDRWLPMTRDCFALGLDIGRCRGSLSADQRGRFAHAVMTARTAAGSAAR
jgi:hypothetical protein